MLNLSKNELRSIAKKRGIISDYKSISKNELIRTINISKPRENNKHYIFESKRNKIKESLMKLSKKKILKSKIKEIKEIISDLVINRDEKIEEIKIHDPKNNILK